MSDVEPIEWEELFPGFLKAESFEDVKEQTFRISNVVRELVTVIGPGRKPTGDKEAKTVLVFDDTIKKLVLNPTNGALIAAMFGKRTSGWIGKRVTFHAEPRAGFGRAGVRVCGSPDIPQDVKSRPGLAPDPSRVYNLRKTGQRQAQSTSQTSGLDLLTSAVADLGISADLLDRWHKASGNGPIDSLDDAGAGKLATYLRSPGAAKLLAKLRPEAEVTSPSSDEGGAS